MMQMETFEQYVAAIQGMAEASGFTEPGVQYCDPEAWRSLYDDGYSAQEAWAEEKSAAAECGS